jgi:hypothetical protein
MLFQFLVITLQVLRQALMLSPRSCCPRGSITYYSQNTEHKPLDRAISQRVSINICCRVAHLNQEYYLITQ